MTNKMKLITFLALGSFFYTASVEACTNFLIKGSPRSGVVASARTVDFNVPINPQILSIPRGLRWTSREDSSQQTGATWTNRYGFVAVGATNEKNLFLDGINEHGLSAAILWLDEAGYMERTGGNDVSTFDLVSYILGQYSTVNQAKAAVRNVNVYGNELQGRLAPIHLIVMDADGESFVAEWINGSLTIYDSATTRGYVDVLANSPPYDQQLANLATYSQLSCYNTSEYSLTGLPGNSASKSRFVRAAKLKQCSENFGGDPEMPFLIDSESEAVERAAVILGRVDKPEGEVVTESDYSNTLSFTRISLIRLHSEVDRRGRPTSKLYFYTPDNRALRVIDLAKIDFKSNRGIRSFLVDSPLYLKAQPGISAPARR
jgi:penicillin V acylase-like amidase (Ntn superfamily)